MNAASLEDMAADALRRAIDNLERRQEPDGSWRGHYGGPAFMLPMYVALCQVSGYRPPIDRVARIRKHLMSTVNSDGSIGLYEGGAGTVFTSTLGYVALRILGEDVQEPTVVRLREWIHENGTPLRSASWGKFSLCLLGLYDYEGIHPLPPEVWLLPYSSPLHPRRTFCQARQVALPMSWLYGMRKHGPIDKSIQDLREELYPRGYDQIDWRKHRSSVAATDNYRPLTRIFRATAAVQQLFEKCVPSVLRKKALEVIVEHIQYENRVTSGLGVSPVDTVLNTLVHHFRDPGGEEFAAGMVMLDEYLWETADTTSMQGYSSTQLWDTAFSLQALDAAGSVDASYSNPRMIASAFRFVDENQILEDPPDHRKYYRELSRGSWPFSVGRQGRPVADCTAEGFKAAMIGEVLGLEPSIGEERLLAAVRLLLSWQNPDGGWASYEPIRGPRWLEWLNPTQVFGDVVIERTYVECTSSVLQAFAVAGTHFPHIAESLERPIAAGRQYLLDSQRNDGSFEGCWGVCFTYGTWFGVWGLLAAGVPVGHQSIERACAFLLSIQQDDNGWGEAPESCIRRRYMPSQGSQVVMTAWALLALIRAGYSAHPAVRNGIRFLIERQHDDGHFVREGYNGVFNRTTMLNYDNYRHYFPLWAFAEWLRASN